MNQNATLFRPAALQRFAANTNVTTDAGLTAEMKTYYDRTLIEAAEPNLVHRQFGEARPIPAGNGRKIEFRAFDPLPKNVTELTEGVTPDGKKMKVRAIEATVGQYGDYVELSDLLELTALDPIVAQTTRAIGAQAGRSLDAIARDVLAAGTNVQYAAGQVASRAALVGGKPDAADNHYLTVDCIKRAVRTMKVNNVNPFEDGYYVAIIHPDVTYDLTSDPDWKKPHEYVDTEHLYNGEIGRVAGVRFVETSEAKIFPGAGAEGRDVYATLVIGRGAYGVSEVEGGGLTTIVKPLGSAGSADPLNQRSTIGWKAILATKILQEQNMVRIETTSTFHEGAVE